MFLTVEDLVEQFKEAGISPSKVAHGMDGKTRFAWHVDDDDDRFVEVTRPAKEGRGYLLVVRYGDWAEAEVLHISSKFDVKFLVGMVRTHLDKMAARRSS